MRYEVQVEGANGGRFEIERSEAVSEGDVLAQVNMSYRVTAVLPGYDGFDGVLEATWRASPTHAWYDG